jgi:hypothetical protein
MRYFGSVTPKRAAVAAGVIGVIGICAVIALLAAKWPFSRAAVIARISKDTGADVSINGLRTTYFPPGFYADGIRLTQRGTGAAILSIRQMRVRAGYTGLIRKKISEIDLRGFQLTAARGRSLGSGSGSGSSFDVSKLVAEDGRIEIQSSDPGHQPFRLGIHSLVLTDLGGAHSDFRVTARAERPPSEFWAEGRLGRFSSKSLKATPVSGRYTVSKADLSVLGGISGVLSSSGNIKGTLGRVEWNGTAVVPDFEVDGTGHKVRLQSAYTVIVDTSDATTELRSIRATFGRSTLLAQGRVSQDASDRGKTLRLSAKMDQGRIDDLLWLVSGQPRPGMTGNVRFNASIELPPAPPKFLRRLVLRGDVEITRALFTNPKTQLPLNYLSESAQGMDKREERASARQIAGVIRGRVDDSGGLARVTNVRYSVPGVNASLDGKFNLITKAIDFRGLLTTQGKLTDGAPGFKSVLLAIARPFLGIRHQGKTTTLLFAIRGSSNRPVLSLSTSKPAHAALRVPTR